MTIDSKRIKALLDSDVSAYEIEKTAHVPRTTIIELRSGKRHLENITFKTAQRLDVYARRVLSEVEATDSQAIEPTIEQSTTENLRSDRHA